MEALISFVSYFINLILHVDEKLVELIAQYGTTTYMILFAIIFCETGFVVTPFLPGDSLLFAAGALAAAGSFDIVTLWLLLWFAAVLGDNVNYWIGYHAGPKVFSQDNGRWLRKDHLDKTRWYFEKYGGKTLIMARFMPFVRTFAPFVAGIGRMSYPRFLAFSVAGGFLWMTIFIWAGYYFGNLPAVRHNFKLVIIGVIAVSLMPMLFEWWKSRQGADEAPPPAAI